MDDIGSHDEWMQTATDKSDGCLPRFHLKAVQNASKSEIEGRPVFDQVAYVEIRIPGDRTSVVNRPVQSADKERWPTAYRRFKENQDRQISGTPLEQWPFLNVSRVAELRALNIFTVEAVASLGDTGLEKVGHGARDLQNRAKAFLKPQSDTETELRAQLQAVTADRDSLKARLDEATRMLADLDEDTAPKKPGRPRKAA